MHSIFTMNLPNDNIFIQIRQKAERDIFRMKVILHRKRVRMLKTVERRKVIKLYLQVVCF